MNSLNKLKIAHKLVLGLAILILIALAGSAFIYVQRGVVEQTAKWTTHTHMVLEEIQGVTAAMVDQETGLRGYMVTENKANLAPLLEGRQEYTKHMQKVRQLTSDNAEQQKRLAAIDEAVKGWQGNVADPAIRLIEAKDVEKARQIERDGVGKQYFDRIRKEAGDVESAERKLLELRDQQSQSAMTGITWAILISAMLMLFLAGIVTWMLTKAISQPISGMTDAMSKLASGNLSVEIPATGRGDEIGQMAQAVLVFKEAGVEKQRLESEAAEQRRMGEEERARNEAARAEAARQIATVVDGLGAGLERLSAGDLTYRVSDSWSAEYLKIRDDFNAALDQLQEIMGGIARSTTEVSNAAAEISTATTDLSQRTEEQAASIEETSASMEQISATVKKNAENAHHANELTRNTQTVADRGGEVVAQAVSAMALIEDSSRKIADIISVIDEIARQTNLVALKAAVEAARAGEAGRGFAVVASEVRSLAQRSSQAAKDIKDLIVNSSTQVQDGVALVNRAGDSLKEIVDSIRSVAEIVNDIAVASTEQASGIDQVNKALAQMDEVTQQNSAMVEENAATARTLEQQAGHMDERIGVFKISGRAADKQQVVAATPGKVVPAKRPAPQRTAAARGPARQMQAALATAVKQDQWEEF